MLAAIVKVSKVMTDEALLEDMKGSFKHKFAKKPEVIDGNMKALEIALKEVKKNMTNINPNTPMEKMTPGGDVYTAGNAREFKTGDWRSVKPIFLV